MDFLALGGFSSPCWWLIRDACLNSSIRCAMLDLMCSGRRSLVKARISGVSGVRRRLRGTVEIFGSATGPGRMTVDETRSLPVGAMELVEVLIPCEKSVELNVSDERFSLNERGIGGAGGILLLVDRSTGRLYVVSMLPDRRSVRGEWENAEALKSNTGCWTDARRWRRGNLFWLAAWVENEEKRRLNWCLTHRPKCIDFWPNDERRWCPR